MNCDGHCCCNDDLNDDYEIQRLEDIIKICEFLIKHRKNKEIKKDFSDLFESDDKEEDKKERDNYYPFYTVNRYYYPFDFHYRMWNVH